MVDKQCSRQLVVQRETEITMNVCYRSWKWKEFKIHNLILLHAPKILLPFPTWHVNYYVCFVYDWKDELVMYDLSSYSVSVKMKKECDIAFVIVSNIMRKPFRDNHYHFLPASAPNLHTDDYTSYIWILFHKVFVCAFEVD